MKTARAALFAALLVTVPGVALAQDAGSRYAGVYKLTGFMLRASVVCPGNKKAMVDRAFRPISSSEFKTFSRAYPKTTEQWMTEGAEFFNNAVMQLGIPAMCAKAG